MKIITLEAAIEKYDREGDGYHVFFCAGEQKVILIEGNTHFETIKQFHDLIKKFQGENEIGDDSLLVIVDGDLKVPDFRNDVFHLLITGDLFCDSVYYMHSDSDCTIVGDLKANHYIEKDDENGTMIVFGDESTPFLYVAEYCWNRTICVNNVCYLDAEYFEKEEPDEKPSDHYGEDFHFIELELPSHDISPLLSQKKSPFPNLPTSELTPQEKAFLFRDKDYVDDATFDFDAFVLRIKSTKNAD